MQFSIRSPLELGLAVRAARKAGHVRLEDIAAATGISKQFTSELEHGKPTAQLGLALRLLDELGVRVILDIPDEADSTLRKLQEQGLRPLKQRGRAKAAG
jgi:transcriptional regulator with XRE-family HTH domain